MLLFPEMPVTKNIFLVTTANLIFLIDFPKILSFLHYLFLIFLILFFVVVVCLLFCELRKCILVSCKMFFTRAISRKKTPFFGLTSLFVQKSSACSNVIQISHDLNAQNRCNNYKTRMKLNKKSRKIKIDKNIYKLCIPANPSLAPYCLSL